MPDDVPMEPRLLASDIADGRMRRLRARLASRALRGLEGGALGAWAEASAAHVPALERTLARGWADLLRGEEAEAAAAAAASTGGPCDVEAGALAALAALERDPGAARLFARQASRLAAGEARRAEACLAHVVLARVRRHTGKPAVAARILSALAPVAPPRWHGWLAWELTLAAGPDAEALPASLAARAIRGDRLAAAALALGAVVRAAGAGDCVAFDREGARLLAAVAACAPLRVEAERLLAAVDDRRPADEEARRFRAGLRALPPGGLQGLAALDADPGSGAISLVLVRPGAPGRRILRLARRLAGGEGDGRGDGEGDRGGDDADALAGAQARVLAGLAALALAGPEGLGTPEFFRAVYGFPYAARQHGSLVDVLVHRMRRALGAAGCVTRDEARLALAVARPLALPDPRGATAPEDGLVRFLVRAGPTTSDAAAAALGIPLRTAQALLRDLVDDGLCQAVRAGRQVVYKVEDTTFQAPADAAEAPRRA